MKLFVLFMILISTFSVCALSKKGAIAQLKKEQQENYAQIQKFSAEVEQNLNNNSSTYRYALAERALKSRVEYQQRASFIDRLIFYFDHKYTGANEKDFVMKTISELVKNEASQSQPNISLWSFLNNLRAAIDSHHEPQNSLISFIGVYLDYSTITSPKPVSGFQYSKDYSDGSFSESAKSTSLQQVGMEVEKKMNQAKQRLSSVENEKPFVLRKPVLKKVEQTVSEHPSENLKLKDWTVDAPLEGQEGLRIRLLPRKK